MNSNFVFIALALVLTAGVVLGAGGVRYWLGRPFDQRTTDYELIAAPLDVELVAGHATPAWAYGGQVPGLELRCRQGDRLLASPAARAALVAAVQPLTDDPAAPRPLTPRLDPAKQTLTLPVALAAGRHTVTITYRGKIGTQAEGFFVDKYPTPSGDKLMLGTQFEPTDARRVFPCWDEPVYRATYDITLVVREKLMAVTNMPAVSEKSLGNGWKEVAFARTPSMASYLVALYAGEFETLEGEQDGVKLRIITTEGKRATAAYALESTKRILAYYNEYFGTPYPLPKLDQIAVPNAFATFGAMENWVERGKAPEALLATVADRHYVMDHGRVIDMIPNHALEANMELPKVQTWFAKMPTSTNAPFADVQLPKSAHMLDYEAELVVVIGAVARGRP